MCMDNTTGNIITYDESAVRLWSLKKMIKSTRIEKNSDHIFLDMFCMNKLEKLLCLFTVKHSNSDKGGSIHILSLNLSHIQTVSGDY